MQRSKTTATIATLVGIAVTAIAVPASAEVTLKTVRGFPNELKGARTAVDVYDVGSDVSIFCGKAGAPLAVGWTDAKALIYSIDDQLGSTNPYFQLEARVPMATTTIRPYAICAKGPVKASVKSKPKGAGAVSCGRKLAIGVPLSSTWPYNDQRAVTAKPVGRSGWLTDEPYSASTAVCVSKSAFGKVKTIRKTASFAAGKSSATVTARCAGERRPIGWGYTAPLMAGNAWESADTDSAIAVPFVSGSLPKGRQGWSLVFRTPDGKPATAAAQVGLHLTCAVPVS